MKTWGSVGIFPLTGRFAKSIISSSEAPSVEKGRGCSVNNWGGGGHPAAAFVQMGLVCCLFGVFLKGGTRVRMRCLQVL